MSYGDWSSDVCSSDLIAGAPDFVGEDQQLEQSGAPAIPTSATRCAAAPPCERRRPRFTHQLRGFLVRDIQIGRASCREGVRITTGERVLSVENGRGDT